MAKSTKGARNILVNDVTFWWRAGRKEGGLSLVVWPADLPGPPIVCSFSREDLAVPTTGDPALDLPIVITNRVVRRVIKLAVGLAYDPGTSGAPLVIRNVGEAIDLVLDALAHRRDGTANVALASRSRSARTGGARRTG